MVTNAGHIIWPGFKSTALSLFSWWHSSVRYTPINHSIKTKDRWSVWHQSWLQYSIPVENPGSRCSHGCSLIFKSLPNMCFTHPLLLDSVKLICSIMFNTAFFSSILSNNIMEPDQHKYTGLAKTHYFHCTPLNETQEFHKEEDPLIIRQQGISK